MPRILSSENDALVNLFQQRGSLRAKKRYHFKGNPHCFLRDILQGKVLVEGSLIWRGLCVRKLSGGDSITWRVSRVNHLTSSAKYRGKTDDFCVRKSVGGIIFMFGKSMVVFASGGWRGFLLLELTEIAISGLMSSARKGCLVTDRFYKGVGLVLVF